MSRHSASTSCNGAAVPKRHFAVHRVLLCALPLLVLLLWIVALAGLAAAGGTATAGSPARVSVQIPPAAKSAGVVMLEISIAVARQPSAGHLGAVVRARSSGGAAIEVGRISLAGSEGSYQFNVARALGQSGGSVEIEVSVIDRGGGPPPAGAALTIGRAQIVTR
ncbi:MAG: hypothetical protein QOF91_792 [Alphaproteobacteria bacterium]|nr:hypothetical protein [Alphaproteobacteria bacterium]